MKIATYTIPEENTQAVVLTGNYVGPNIPLNGLNCVNGVFSLTGIERTIKLFAYDVDLSGVIFTITGISNNRTKTITLTGPTLITFVEPGTRFSKIISITVDQPVTGLSIGTGSKSNTEWRAYDYHLPFPSLTVQYRRPSTHLGSVTFYSTSFDMQKLDILPQLDPDYFIEGIITRDSTLPNGLRLAMAGDTTSASDRATLNETCSFFRWDLDGDVDDEVAATITFVQQGLTD